MSNSVLANEEQDMIEKTALLNAYVINYNKLNGTKGGLLEKIDISNPSSTNNKIASFYEDLKNYNKNKKDIYLSNERSSDKDFVLELEGDKYFSNSKIMLFVKLISEPEWIKKNWKIV